MSIAERTIVPPQEKLAPDSQKFSFTSIFTPREILPEVYVSITFTFEGRDPHDFRGHIYRILPGQDKVCEAESFFDAAQNAWTRYGRSESNSNFVKEKLSEKWCELDGEALTGKTLDFSVTP